MNELYNDYLDFLIKFEESDCIEYAKNNCKECPFRKDSLCVEIATRINNECAEDLKKRKEEKC